MSFSPKRASEVETFSVDFVNLLPSMVTIASASWSMTVLKGVDANANAMIQGQPAVAGSVVSTKIGAGVPDNFYAPICTAVLSNGNTVVLPEPGRGILRITA